MGTPVLQAPLICQKMTDLDVFEGPPKPKCPQQVEHNRNDNNRVQDAFDFSIHGDVGVHQPKQHPDDDQNGYDVDKGHGVVFPFGRPAATPGECQSFMGVGGANEYRDI